MEMKIGKFEKVEDEKIEITPEAEIAAMRAIALALKDFDREAKERVLEWAVDKYLGKYLNTRY